MWIWLEEINRLSRFFSWFHDEPLCRIDTLIIENIINIEFPEWFALLSEIAIAIVIPIFFSLFLVVESLLNPIVLTQIRTSIIMFNRITYWKYWSLLLIISYCFIFRLTRVILMLNCSFWILIEILYQRNQVLLCISFGFKVIHNHIPRSAKSMVFKKCFDIIMVWTVIDLIYNLLFIYFYNFLIIVREKFNLFFIILVI